MYKPSRNKNSWKLSIFIVWIEIFICLFLSINISLKMDSSPRSAVNKECNSSWKFFYVVTTTSTARDGQKLWLFWLCFQVIEIKFGFFFISKNKIHLVCYFGILSRGEVARNFISPGFYILLNCNKNVNHIRISITSSSFPAYCIHCWT